MTIPTKEHNIEIGKNLRRWEEKPLLRKIYADFYHIIARHLRQEPNGCTIEIGSGSGNIKDSIPSCLRTDLFPNPWIDRVENAYSLSFQNGSVAAIILFDVFHHLRHPGTALREFYRVLMPQGRVIIFDPFISPMGRLVYGLLHHEPVAYAEKIEWYAPPSWRPEDDTYYAAQGNFTRIFFSTEYRSLLQQWRIVSRQRLAAFSYVTAGGYSGPQLYPSSFYPLLKIADKIFDCLPSIFATRGLAVLEKNTTSKETVL